MKIPWIACEVGTAPRCTEEWPTKRGHYWFYGWRDDEAGCIGGEISRLVVSSYPPDMPGLGLLRTNDDTRRVAKNPAGFRARVGCISANPNAQGSTIVHFGSP